MVMRQRLKSKWRFWLQGQMLPLLIEVINNKMTEHKISDEFDVEFCEN